MRVAAHSLLGMTLHHQGELLACREQFELAGRLYDPADQPRYFELYRFDPWIDAAAELVRTLWLLGFPDQARRLCQDTLALARGVSNPLSLAFCYVFVSYLHQLLHEAEETRSAGAACIALCDEHGIEWERAWASSPYGWAVAELGEVDEGIALIRACLELQHRKGNEIAIPEEQAILGEALWKAGRIGEALEAVEEGLAVSRRTGDSYYDAGLLRLKGQLLESDDSAAAECCFQRALEIAREQSALSLELRAATSLGRLWLKQGKRTEAEGLVRSVYGRFTEGFETYDLAEARSLLDELVMT